MTKGITTKILTIQNKSLAFFKALFVTVIPVF